LYGVFCWQLWHTFDAELPTEPMVAMVPMMVGKVEQDQRFEEGFRSNW